MYYCDDSEYVLMREYRICTIVRVRNMYYCEDTENVLL